MEEDEIEASGMVMDDCLTWRFKEECSIPEEAGVSVVASIDVPVVLPLPEPEPAEVGRRIF